VFLTTSAALTDDTPDAIRHLYMWHHAPNDEVQQLTVSASGGTFTLTFDGQTTAALPANATATQVETALNVLSSVSGANGTVTVTGGPGDDAGTSPYLITFARALAGRDLPLMSADGSTLIGSTPTGTVAPWVAGGGHLTLIDRDEEPADAPGRAEGVIGTSQDGTYVYLIANSQLVAGQPPILGGTRDIYVWHDGQIAFIGTLTLTGSVADWTLNMPASDGNGQPWGSDVPSRVTPSGRTLVLGATSGSGLTGFDHTGCGDDGRAECQELYVYQADSARLTCATCPTNGPPSSDASSYLTGFLLGVASTPHQSRALSDDGRRVFFTTADALVPEDANGRKDVYEYDTLTGTTSLISSGKSTSDSYFVEANANGDDAFFMTREQLLGWDVDAAYDLYDARVGGGFPEPVRPPQCEGAACQGPLSPAPPAANTGSTGLTGAGNVPDHIRRHRARPKRCRRGTVRRKVHGKTRCIKRRKARHHRTATHTTTRKHTR